MAAEKFKLKGLCVCGHNPEEDPNEDCERCWMVTQILDLTQEAADDSDSLSMLRDRATRLRELVLWAVRSMEAFDPSSQTGASLKADAGLIRDSLAAAFLEPRP